MRVSRRGLNTQNWQNVSPPKQLCSLNILLECAISDEERVWELNELCWRSSHLLYELWDIQQACVMRCSHYSLERHCMEKWTEPVLRPPLGLAELVIVCWLTQRPLETGKRSGAELGCWLCTPRCARASVFLQMEIREAIAACFTSAGCKSWVDMSETLRLVLGMPDWRSTVVPFFWSDTAVAAKGRKLSGYRSELT